MNLNGVVLNRVNPPKVNGEYTTQTIVVETEVESKYPQMVQVELGKKLVDGNLAETLRPGDVLDMEINVRGRDYTAKDGTTQNFTGLQAWRITKTGSGGVMNSNDEKPTNTAAPTTHKATVVDDSDSPF